MSDQPEGPTTQRRRMSLVEMFNTRPNLSNANTSAGTPSSPESPQHRRGVSISTLGLAGSGQTQPSPYNAFARQRRASISTSSASGSPEFRNSFGDEPAVIEEDDTVDTSNFGSPSSPSFARRVSFGAQALRDVRQSGGGAASGGEGFNWSEALRDRTKRSPSFSTGNPFAAGVNRSKSTAGTVTAPPPQEMPRVASPPTKMKKPDHLGERMLRGDFMMD